MIILALLYLVFGGLFWSMLANVTLEGWKSGVLALVWPLTVLLVVVEAVRFRCW